MESIAIEGVVTAAFVHRFVVEGEQGRALIDVGPDARLPISEGDRISAEGEPRPSEVKVTSITLADGSIHRLERGSGKHRNKHADAAAIGPEAVLDVVRAAGYEVDGAVRRRPKHCEVLARKDGEHFAVHLELDGAVRKAKLVEPEA